MVAMRSARLAVAMPGDRHALLEDARRAWALARMDEPGPARERGVAQALALLGQARERLGAEDETHRTTAMRAWHGSLPLVAAVFVVGLGLAALTGLRLARAALRPLRSRELAAARSGDGALDQRADVADARASRAPLDARRAGGHAQPRRLPDAARRGAGAGAPLRPSLLPPHARPRPDLPVELTIGVGVAVFPGGGPRGSR